MFYYKLLESLISNFSTPQTAELLEAFKTLFLKRFQHIVLAMHSCLHCLSAFHPRKKELTSPYFYLKVEHIPVSVIVLYLES